MRIASHKPEMPPPLTVHQVSKAPAVWEVRYGANTCSLRVDMFNIVGYVCVSNLVEIVCLFVCDIRT